MSLSVERLKELYADIEPEENAAAGLVICSAKADEFAAAIRELIKIKETKPDAYISAIDFSQLPNADIIGGFPVSRNVELDDDIQLIRKPE